MRVFLMAALAAGIAGVAPLMADEATTARAKKFIAAHEAKFKPLDRRAGIAWWDANISGKDEDFAKKEAAQNAIDAALADPVAFAEVKELKEASKAGKIDDKIANNQCLVCWTVGRTTVMQTRNPATTLENDWLAGSRQFGWNFLGAFLARTESQRRSSLPESQIESHPRPFTGASGVFGGRAR